MSVTDLRPVLPEQAWCTDTGELVVWRERQWQHDDGTRCTHDLTERRPYVSPEARRVGLLAMVTVGQSLWSTQRSDHNGDRLGGIVVDVGEIVEDGQRIRVYTCLDDRVEHGRSFRARRIREDELDELSVDLPNSLFIKAMIGRLCETTAKAMRRGGPVLPEVVDWMKWAHELSVILVFGGKR